MVKITKRVILPKTIVVVIWVIPYLYIKTLPFIVIPYPQNYFASSPYT